MKVFLCIFITLFSLITTDAYAMFEKTNKSLLGRPKFRKPSFGTIYAGVGIGIPAYGITNINDADFGNPSASTAIRGAIGNNATSNIGISLPLMDVSVGYIQLSLPLRHEFSLSFLNNSFGVAPSKITINGNPYTNSKAVIQNFFLTYYLYGFYSLKILPIVLFIGGGGGLAVFNSTLSDGGTSTINMTNPIQPVTTTTVSASMTAVSVGGVVGIAGGFTYRISDDLAIQLKLGYSAVSAPFTISNGAFPFIQMITLNVNMFFKIL